MPCKTTVSIKMEKLRFKLLTGAEQPNMDIMGKKIIIGIVYCIRCECLRVSEKESETETKRERRKGETERLRERQRERHTQTRRESEERDLDYMDGQRTIAFFNRN